MKKINRISIIAICLYAIAALLLILMYQPIRQYENKIQEQAKETKELQNKYDSLDKLKQTKSTILISKPKQGLDTNIFQNKVQ